MGFVTPYHAVMAEAPQNIPKDLHHAVSMIPSWAVKTGAVNVSAFCMALKNLIILRGLGGKPALVTVIGSLSFYVDKTIGLFSLYIC